MWERIKRIVSEPEDKVYSEERSNISSSEFSSPVIADLNKMQREAVLNDNRRILVLAGAGSGKTKTLIQKVLFLLSEKHVEPKEILAITFTKNATNEMIDRLILAADKNGDYQKIIENKKLSFKDKEWERRNYILKYPWLSSITVKTFHSLCNQILRSHGSDEFDNKFKILSDSVYDAETSSRQVARETSEEIIRKIILELSEDMDFLLSLKRYILDYYVDVFNIKLHKKRPDTYEKPYTTLKGDQVRSKSERDIADWLYRHRVKYEYEPMIQPDKFEMQPDFFISEANLYLEHVSKKSCPLEDKERVMKEAGENYVKIFERAMSDTNEFYKTMDEIVLSKIDKNLKNCKPLDFAEEFRGYEKFLRYFILDILKMIDKVKVEDKNFNEIYERSQSDPHERIQIFYRLAKSIFKGYETYCRAHSYLDFNDLINKTVSLLNSNDNIRKKYQKKYNYILVDEFQDVNTLQVSLLKSLLNDDTQLFCVGDDWQSIYGFRGSNVEYIVKFEKHFKNPIIIKLNVNYRSNNTIVSASNEVIKNNKFKIEKEIKSFQQSGRKIYLYASQKEEEDGVKIVITNVDKLLQNEYLPEDILVLSRTRKSDAFAKYYFELTKKKIKVTTIHQAKGLEAKIVFITGLVDGFYGFPNVRDDDRIFQIIKKNNYELQLEEERRLFYVALTRAKEELFLISEVGNESSFINEIPGKFLDRANFLILNINNKQKAKICMVCKNEIKISLDFKYCPFCGNEYFDKQEEPQEKNITEDRIINQTDLLLFDRIREWRLNKATKNNIPPFCILHNSTVYDIIEKKPLSILDFEKVHGIGRVKLEKYGDELIEIIKSCFNDEIIEEEDNEPLVIESRSKKEVTDNKPTKQDAQYNEWLIERRKNHPNSHKPWTSEEDEILRNEWLKGTSNRKIALKLNRSLGAIDSRALKLKIFELLDNAPSEISDHIAKAQIHQENKSDELNQMENTGLIILKCLHEIKTNTGRSLLTDTLQGKSRLSSKIQDTKVYRNDYFGMLKSYTRSKIFELIDYLIIEGYITEYLSSYKNPLVGLTERGKSAIVNNTQIQFKKITKDTPINPILIIGLRGDSKDIPRLIEYTKSQNDEDRRLAAYALGKLGNNKPEIYTAMQTIIDLLEDKNSDVRISAVNALISIDKKEALPYLSILGKNDKNEDVKKAANQAIQRIKKQ